MTCLDEGFDLRARRRDRGEIGGIQRPAGSRHDRKEHFRTGPISICVVIQIACICIEQDEVVGVRRVATTARPEFSAIEAGRAVLSDRCEDRGIQRDSVRRVGFEAKNGIDIGLPIERGVKDKCKISLPCLHALLPNSRVSR